MWKEEFQNIPTFPHHYHDEHGNVKPSSLIGVPTNDIDIVLDEISGFISGKVKGKQGKKIRKK